MFTNTNCSWNKGSAAQIIGTMKGFYLAFGESHFTLFSQELGSDTEAALHLKKYGYIFDINGYTTEKKYHNSLFKKIRPQICLLVYAIVFRIARLFRITPGIRLKNRILSSYNKADLIVDLSGDSFSDDGRIGFSIINCLSLLISYFLKKPFILYSQSMGPFNWYSRPLVRFCLQRSKVIIIRENISLDYLRRLHLKNVPIFVKPDCAFCMESAHSDRIREIFVNEEIKNDTNNYTVGISVSGDLERANPNYVRLIAGIVDWLVESYNTSILLVSHVFAGNWKNAVDDRMTASNVFSMLKHSSSVYIIKNEYSPIELKGIIGNSYLFIGSRMHANIAALSMGIPTISIGYTHKYQGIMNSFGLGEFALESDVDPDKLTKTVSLMWNNYNTIRSNLLKKCIEINNLSLNSIIDVKDIISNSINYRF